MTKDDLSTLKFGETIYHKPTGDLYGISTPGNLLPLSKTPIKYPKATLMATKRKDIDPKEPPIVTISEKEVENYGRLHEIFDELDPKYFALFRYLFMKMVEHEMVLAPAMGGIAAPQVGIIR